MPPTSASSVSVAYGSGARPIAETTATVAKPSLARVARRARTPRRAPRASRPTFRRTSSTATAPCACIHARTKPFREQQFENLHRVGRRAFAQLIADAPQREVASPPLGVVFGAQARDVHARRCPRPRAASRCRRDGKRCRRPLRTPPPVPRRSSRARVSTKTASECAVRTGTRTAVALDATGPAGRASCASLRAPCALRRSTPRSSNAADLRNRRCAPARAGRRAAAARPRRARRARSPAQQLVEPRAPGAARRLIRGDAHARKPGDVANGRERGAQDDRGAVRHRERAGARRAASSRVDLGNDERHAVAHAERRAVVDDDRAALEQRRAHSARSRPRRRQKTRRRSRASASSLATRTSSVASAKRDAASRAREANAPRLADAADRAPPARARSFRRPTPVAPTTATFTMACRPRTVDDRVQPNDQTPHVHHRPHRQRACPATNDSRESESCRIVSSSPVSAEQHFLMRDQAAQAHAVNRDVLALRPRARSAPAVSRDVPDGLVLLLGVMHFHDLDASGRTAPPARQSASSARRRSKSSARCIAPMPRSSCLPRQRGALLVRPAARADDRPRRRARARPWRSATVPAAWCRSSSTSGLRARNSSLESSEIVLGRHARAREAAGVREARGRVLQGVARDAPHPSERAGDRNANRGVQRDSVA